ncbi:UNVERIFIED_CONTAM: BTB/POZ domain-containing protein [Sesamum angustifolium]|uniref:BTB/POZ domain-containing protein n=1 Tax=Sesamum angustifolium TaxID=2727405 RepID=A0AAW2JBI4_9LAMI
MQSSTESDNNNCRIETMKNWNRYWSSCTAEVPKKRWKNTYNCRSLQTSTRYHSYRKHHMLGSLNSSNALDVLEISDTCSNQSLKETALNFIVRNMEDIVFSARFDAFALKNPHLTVQITRASFMDIRNRRAGV